MSKIEIDYDSWARRKAWARTPVSLRDQYVPERPDDVRRRMALIEAVLWLLLVVSVVLTSWLVLHPAIASALDFASDTPPVSGLVVCPKVGRVTYASVFVQVGPSPNGIVVATVCSATSNPVATLECRCTGRQASGCGLEYYHDWLTTLGTCQ
jgi:hypothetical protein